MVFGSMAVKPGVDFEEPLGMILIPPFYAVMANLCYTLGWIVDIAAYRRAPRVWLLRAGIIPSAALTLSPGVWAVGAWITTLITGKKLD